jgi:hypothetical protein
VVRLEVRICVICPKCKTEFEEDVDVDIEPKKGYL